MACQGTLTQGAVLTARDVAQAIDHSLLRPDITHAELLEGLRMARKYGVATCCVRPMDVPIAREELAGSVVRVSSVVGFPHGAHTTETKVFEANQLRDLGAAELDMVLAFARLKSGRDDYVYQDVRAVVDAAHARSVIVKVIMECFYLTDEEKVRACQICEAAGADYVKTSTGYSGGGATLEDVRLMRRTCSPKVAVKAAGGIRDLDATLRFLAAGAKMIGTRSTQAIMEEALQREREGTLRLP